MAHFYGWGSTASRLEPLRGGSLLFTLSSQKFLVLILSTSEGWKAESTLEPLCGFEHGIPGLGIQRLNHYAIAPLTSIYQHWPNFRSFSTQFSFTFLKKDSDYLLFFTHINGVLFSAHLPEILLPFRRFLLVTVIS